MRKLIISAPFGNYYRIPLTTRTRGTYTIKSRAGFFKRWWRVLSTVRYDHKSNSWTNRLGLPNPGIAALVGSTIDVSEDIVSVLGYSSGEWGNLMRFVCALGARAVELNLSCPNTDPVQLDDVLSSLTWALSSSDLKVIAKLPPVDWMYWGKPLYSVGVHHFHLCNTIPTSKGGQSGAPLKPLSLRAVSEFRQTFPDSVLIGGGGITKEDDIVDYFAAGADHVAVASVLLNPFNWRKVCKLAEFADTCTA